MTSHHPPPRKPAAGVHPSRLSPCLYSSALFRAGPFALVLAGDGWSPCGSRLKPKKEKVGRSLGVCGSGAAQLPCA